jgi:hypothetical protein
MPDDNMKELVFARMKESKEFAKTLLGVVQTKDRHWWLGSDRLLKPAIMKMIGEVPVQRLQELMAKD